MKIDRDLHGLYDLGPEGDPWSSAMMAHFDIAEVLHVNGHYVPPHWGFTPAPVLYLSEGGHALLEALRRGETTPLELRWAGDVLERYERVLERAGMSY